MAQRVLIVDDDAGFRAAARRVLEAETYEVVGEAPDGESGIDAARSLAPDVVLLDIHMPGLDGFAVAARLADEEDPPTVVLISTMAEDEIAARVDPGHVHGFLSKDRLSGPTLAAVLAG